MVGSWWLLTSLFENGGKRSGQVVVWCLAIPWCCVHDGKRQQIAVLTFDTLKKLYSFCFTVLQDKQIIPTLFLGYAKSKGPTSLVWWVDQLLKTLLNHQFWNGPRYWTRVHSAGPGRPPLWLAQEWFPRTPGCIYLPPWWFGRSFVTSALAKNRRFFWHCLLNDD